MSRGFWAAIGVVGIAAGAAWWWWKRENEMQDLVDKLTAALPGRAAAWARQLAYAAYSTAPADVGALRWGLILGAVMERESGSGQLLSPRGPGGTGDGGHGHGLMQIDDREGQAGDPTWPIRRALVAGESWKDPQLNINAGARILRIFYEMGNGDFAPALAAYNAGPRVFAAANPDALTTGGDYSSDVLARADSFEQSLQA